MKILVTGGAGYIGSHVVVEMINAGHEPIVIDNLSNSSKEAINRVEKITGKKIEFHKIDLLDEAKLDELVDGSNIEAVIHMAGLKAIGESVSKPLEYYENNLVGSLNLLKVMRKHGINKIIFSSSAAVYGVPDEVPITEVDPSRQPTNPYGWTKAVIEQMIEDLVVAEPNWSVTLLRYFNPIGAHSSGLIGEDPSGIPNNLMPSITQVAVGKLNQLKVYGNDYDTADGTGVRDYIHVVDLAKGHVAALEHLKPGCNIYNLGTSEGYSVMEVIEAFEAASGKKINYEIAKRRPDDVAEAYADASKAQTELGWKAKKSLQEACADSWNWQQQNPDGFKS